MAAGARPCFVRVSWALDPLARARSPGGQAGCFLGKEVGTMATEDVPIPEGLSVLSTAPRALGSGGGARTCPHRLARRW